MLLRLRQSAAPLDAIEALDRRAVEAGNVLSRGSDSEAMLRAYLECSIESVRMLETHFDSRDVETLILTRRYWSLQSASPASRDMVPTLVMAAVAQQKAALEHEKAQLSLSHHRWQDGHLVVPDTSALVHGPKLWDWDPSATFGLRDDSVQIVIPILVLDELDGLKEHTKQHTKNRARETLRWLSSTMGASPTTIRQTSVGRGTLTVDVMMDDPGHRRLPIADDEIVDRAAHVASLSGRTVRFVTNDHGQAFRASRIEALTVEMTADPIYDVDIQEEARRVKQAEKERQRQASRARSHDRTTD